MDLFEKGILKSHGDMKEFKRFNKIGNFTKKISLA